MSREYPCVYHKNGLCEKFTEPGYINYCVFGPCTEETPSNADRIRAMSDEELARWLLDVMSHKVACFGEGAFRYTPCRNEEHDCVKCGIEWLQQPAENPVKWSKPGPCPVTPEQFDAIYNDEEETT